MVDRRRPGTQGRIPIPGLPTYKREAVLADIQSRNELSEIDDVLAEAAELQEGEAGDPSLEATVELPQADETPSAIGQVAMDRIPRGETA